MSWFVGMSGTTPDWLTFCSIAFFLGAGTIHQLRLILVALLPEMETHTLGNILLTRCMVLECTTLLMGTNMKELGMKEEEKGLACIFSKMEGYNLAIGNMGFSVLLADSILELHMLWIIQKYSMWFREKTYQRGSRVQPIHEKLSRIYWVVDLFPFILEQVTVLNH